MMLYSSHVQSKPGGGRGLREIKTNNCGIREGKHPVLKDHASAHERSVIYLSFGVDAQGLSGESGC